MTKRFRPFAVLLGALLAATACSDAPEPMESSQQALGGVILRWSAATSQTLHRIAPRNGGSALASTRQDVIAFSTTGSQSVVFDGSASNHHPIVREGTEGFAIPAGSTFRVYDAVGAPKASVPRTTNQYLRLIPGGLQTFVPGVEGADPETGRVTEGRILSSAGAVQATFAAPDLVQSETTSGGVLWATRTTFNKTSLTGTSLWSTPLRVQKFEANASGRYSIVNRAGNTRVVELYDEKTKIGGTTFGTPVWNLAIAPLGKWAAANDKTFTRLFQNGVLQASIGTGTTTRPISLDVSDLGYVLVSTQSTAQAQTKIWLYDAAGALQWSKTLPNETQAYRPEVRFTPNGLGFFVREKTTLSYYGLVNP